MDEKKHKLGVKPTHKKGQGSHSQPITGFMRAVDCIPSAEEAIL
jgi:hypothetical protein